MLSIHPGMGSLAAAVTMDGRTMLSGRSLHVSRSHCSVTAFVPEYTFVQLVASKILQPPTPSDAIVIILVAT